MPKIELSKLIACAKGLSAAAGDMGQGVQAQLQGGLLVIKEGVLVPISCHRREGE